MKTTTSNEEPPALFKACPKCGKQWTSYAAFLRDPEIRLLGFQPGTNGHLDGFFLFHHERCATSLAVNLSALQMVCPLPVQVPSMCAGGALVNYCLARTANQPCPMLCVCEFVSCVSRVIESWPKERSLL